MPDLEAYVERINYAGPLRPDLDTLRSLHALHPAAIPFENLSTVLGEPVPIDVDSVFGKLVTRRRGGYCFEHNTLLQAVLARIGFEVVPLCARVVWSAAEGYENPRTHMVLLVPIGGERWIVDVGFGGATLTAPLKLQTGVVQPTPHESVRLVDIDIGYELQAEWDGRWRAMYQFDLQPQRPIDFEALNHYVATHPRSHFRTTLLAGRVAGAQRLALINGKFSTLSNGSATATRSLQSGSELGELLRDEFGIAADALAGSTARLDELVSLSV